MGKGAGLRDQVTKQQQLYYNVRSLNGDAFLPVCWECKQARKRGIRFLLHLNICPGSARCTQFFSSLLSFCLFWPPHGIWSSQARDGSQAAAESCAAAAATPDCLILFVGGWGSNPSLSAPETPLVPLRHGRNSQYRTF